MRKLKLFFACLLMAVLSIGQMWADATFVSANEAATSAKNGILLTVTSGSLASGDYYRIDKGATLTISSESGNIESIVFTCTTAAYAKLASHSPEGTYSEDDTAVSWEGSASSVTFTAKTGSSNKNFRFSQVVITTASSGPAQPTVSADPTSVSVEAADVENQSVTLTASNFASSISSATTGLYSDAECNTAITSGEWVKNITVNAAKTAVTFDVDDNDGAQRQCWLKITLGDGTSTASAILPITQAKYSAPTGTFALYSGNITEGDYVIYYSGKAMNTTESSSRLQYAEITPSNDKIVDPDEAIIWHIAASGDYWTLYNEAEKEYAAATGTKNQAQMLADGTDDKSLWTVSGTSTYEFVNKNNSANSVNANLRNNGTYGFACYATGTGGALSLYKKDDGKPSAPTFSPAAGSFLEAQNVTISTLTDGATIYYTTDGSTPTTSSSAYSSAIPVSATTTIKAIAVKDAVSSSVASATFTITTPLTIAQAVALVPNVDDAVDDQFVEGYVCTAGTSVSSGQMSYYISADGKDDGVVEHKLQIYKGKNLNNTNFSATSDLAVGDKVIVYGQLLHYNETKYEMNSGNYIARYTAKGDLTSVVVSGTPTKTVYANGDAFEPAGLVVTATYANGYAVDVTDEVTANEDWAVSPATIIASGDVAVTATYGGMTSAAYNVAVEKASKTLVSISLSSLSEEESQVWQGLELPKPTVTAHYTEGEDEDVTALATFTGYDNTTPGEQTITVSYSLGESDSKTYTVTVKSIYNVELAASVARNLIINSVGSEGSGDNEMIIRGIVVNPSNPSSSKQTYYISDDGTNTNTVEVYKGLYLESASFTSSNKLLAGDEVVVKGSVKYFNSSIPEFNEGAVLQSLARTPQFEIADVAEFEVGAADLAVADLTITQDGEGAVTLASSNKEEFVTIEGGKLHAVAPGTATITANLDADGIYKAKTATFDVTVIAAQVKYAITFDDNGADGGSAPDAIADKAAGAEVTLPANSYTKTGHTFDGWKVYDENEDEVTVTAGAFTMPASPVTIKAQWAEIPVWAYTYTSNVAISSNTAAHVTIGGTDYDAAKTSKGANATITLPQGVTTIHLHLVAWNGEAQTVTVSGACFNEDKELAITDNSGVSGQGTTYDLGASGVDYYYSLTPDNEVAANEIITISAAGSKRFVLFGVNQEGGIVPVLQSLAVSGDLENKTYEAGAAINPAGLTVMGTYTLGGTPQAPVVVTDQVEEWLYDALQVGDESITISAKIGTVTSAGYEISGLTVTDPTPRFETNPTSYISFGSKEQGATITARDLEVTLVNVSNASVEITGTGAAAFSVDEDALTGNATLHVSASSANVGTFAATLTISDEAGVAADKEISLSLTVTAPVVEETAVSTTSEWVVATDADLVDGVEVLITGATGGVTYAIGVQNDNNRAAVAGTLEEGVFTPDENTMSFTLVAQEEEGVFALQASNGEYLYAASSSKNYLKRQATLDDNAKWTLTATSAVANGSNTHNDLKFNATNSPKIFSCYTGGQTAIQFYVPKTVTPTKYSVTVLDLIDHGTVVSDKAEAEENETVTLTITADEGFTLTELWVNMDNVVSSVSAGTYSFSMPAEDVEISALFTQTTPSYTEVRNGLNAGEYYTMCLDKAVTAVQGGTIWRVLSKAQSSSDIILEEVEGTLDAGRPYIFFATAATLEVAYTGDAVGAPIPTGNNGLVGSFSQAHIDNVNTNYIIYNNELYYVNTDNVYVGAHRAYIDMTAVPDYSEPQQGNAPRRRVTMHTNAPQVATGIDALNASDKPVKMVINGQLFIIRGEKMFDAKGQLVK